MKKHRLFITLLIVLAVQAAQADNIKVVGQNLQNFFYSLDRGRTQGNGSITLSNYNTESGRTAKLNAIVGTLSQYEADIYAFNEVECCAEVLQLLAQSMSEKTGKNYMPVTDGLSYDLTSEPDGAIKSGFIYNAATIEPVGENLSTAVGYNHIYPATMRMQGFKSKPDDEVFYISLNNGQYWPTLWEYDPSITVTGITQSPAYRQPSTTRKVIEQGHLIIITPSGSRYNLQGIQIR
jgi:hypothetical protein